MNQPNTMHAINITASNIIPATATRRQKRKVSRSKSDTPIRQFSSESFHKSYGRRTSVISQSISMRTGGRERCNHFRHLLPLMADIPHDKRVVEGDGAGREDG